MSVGALGAAGDRLPRLYGCTIITIFVTTWNALIYLSARSFAIARADTVR